VTRMAKRNALVKNLTSVETLGCTTVICSDKTGTLTQNLMMVTQVYVDGEFVQVTGSGYRPRGEFVQDGRRLPLEEISRRPAFRHLLECALVCNNARIEETASGYRVLGDPTEGALIALAEKAGMRGIHQRLHLNPFESIRKKMSVVVRLEGRGETTAYLKGAPLETLAVCDRVLSRGEVRPLDQASRDEIIAANDALASRGLRVLALASRDDPFLQEGSGYGIAEVERQLIFLGLAAISDPVRPEVPEAVRACHAAGIRVIMITGDYALTAVAIGREIGLGNGLSLDVFSGTQVSAMADDRLRSLLARGETIFARVAPEHKLRIVSLLKEMGEVVAVTGDGVNDAPALKKADIGIAMGVRGNDVAKEAAHMILTDDNFSSIVAAIEEGRAIFENIRRFMAYIFNSNPQEMYPYLIWILFPGMPLAMTVMGVLAVDVGTDLIPAMGLGIEPPEKGIMERPPRRRNERLLSLRFILRSYFVQGSLLAFSSYATYYYMGWVLGYWRPGLSLSSMPASPPGLRLDEATGPYLQTLTAYFFPTVTTQIANVLSKRSWKASLFSPDFLNPAYRRNLLNAIAASSPGRAIRAASNHSPVAERLAGFLERHYILLNFVSNPLINLGILFELFLCYLFFYSPLARIYYFAPVPWHVYLFAFHGTALLLAFEEIKKYYRRKGHPLEFLG
jgi:magnesium-transporting ATPase (P-type)